MTFRMIEGFLRYAGNPSLGDWKPEILPWGDLLVRSFGCSFQSLENSNVSILGGCLYLSLLYVQRFIVFVVVEKVTFTRPRDAQQKRQYR